MKLLTKNLTVLVLMMTILFAGDYAAASSQVHLSSQNISSQSSSWDLDYNSWGRNNPFVNSDGDIVTNGIGYQRYSSNRSRTFTSFNISEFNHTTFETTVSLDNNYNTGDRGKTEVAVYADNQLLYTETFSNTTPKNNLKLALPENTSTLTVFAIFKGGNQGSHRVILEEPKLTNALNALAKDDSLSLSSVGVSASSSSWDWNFGAASGRPFEMLDGRLIGRGYQLSTYSSNRIRNFIEFPVRDYNHSTFETTISVDRTASSGDRGKTQVLIYADDHKLYSKTFTNTTPEEVLALPLPEGTETLRMYAIQQRGGQGHHRINFENPLLTNSKQQLEEVNRMGLNRLGVADSSSSWDWSANSYGSLPFDRNDGTLEAKGYALLRYSSNRNTVYTSHYIGDHSLPYFETTLSVDGQYASGDRGTTKVEVLADGKSIFNKTVNNRTQPEELQLNIPAGTQFLRLQATYSPGSNGTHRIIFGEPALTDGKTPNSQPRTSDGFNDISSQHPYQKEIALLTNRAIINGYQDGTFRPNNNITRRQAALMISRAFDLDLKGRPNPGFGDVAATLDGYAEIAAVMDEGLFDSFIRGSQFRPNQQLTRGEMASILATAYNLDSTSSTSPLTDISNHWARDYIVALADHNITTGFNDQTFRPNQSLTRAHFSVFMARAEDPAFRP
ncbi:S-layer homology domain-containing protein [Alkalihalophilus pseudofirmus]|uniref:S-layer homology domain-containing protein n=1 Tax=Alkalihalophilus pseudofirmus TaxID=79885 RepID=A0AAJ2NQ23_ALKPS|nr:S-layer homology domain-containing protein [Alkalihalophilus pseudofirmus]MDV2886342.1 S-layer homology domain-containing protein [Alkalihalophilus pseudofirmus]